MMMREFKASRDYLLAPVDEGMEAEPDAEDAGPRARAASSGGPGRRASPSGA